MWPGCRPPALSSTTSGRDVVSAYPRDVIQDVRSSDTLALVTCAAELIVVNTDTSDDSDVIRLGAVELELSPKTLDVIVVMFGAEVTS